MSTPEIRKLNDARSVVPISTFPSTVPTKQSKIFSGIAFGKNVHLQLHVDHDFTFSIVTALTKKERYELKDDPLVYFCFPRHGVAITIHPGDILVFNPSEPHTVSSRYNSSIDSYVLSFYLKSSIVGGNNNSIPLTENEVKVLDVTKKNKKCC